MKYGTQVMIFLLKEGKISSFTLKFVQFPSSHRLPQNKFRWKFPAFNEKVYKNWSQ